MQKVRVHEIAKELGIKSKDLLEKAKEYGIEIKTASSAVAQEEAEALVNYIITGKPAEETEKPKTEAPQPTPEKTVKETKSTTVSRKSVEEPTETVKPEEKTAVSSDTEQETLKKESVKSEKPALSKAPSQPIAESSTPPVKPAEKPKESVPTTTPKSEIKPAHTPTEKTEGIKPLSEPRETLAQATVKKRRGLVIVKKNKKRTPEVKAEPEKTTEPAQGTPSIPVQPVAPGPEEGQDERRKKKKVKKQTSTSSRKDFEQKIDILSARDLKEAVDIEDDDEEVMLMDLSAEERKNEMEEEQRKKQTTDKVKVTRQNRFMEHRSIRRSSRRKRAPKKEIKTEEITGQITIPEDIRVYEFADKIGKTTGDVIRVLFNLGLMITKNDFLDKDALEILAEEFELDIEISNPLENLDYMAEYEEVTEDTEEGLEERPPVVTIMGHVDHGKTSLLDKIRNSRVASGEAGGITQHIGAYMVEKDGKKISFIDTPGHEAFTEMRSRGARITDIAIIVVAADDGVQPQTKEALSHAKAAKVPIIVAVNKVDKPEANPDMIRSQMAEIGYTAVDWGGEHEFVHVSAKSGEGIDDLLETILLQSEIMELQANPHHDAKAIVVESSLEKGKGPVATVIVQNGTLKIGDSVVVDTEYGRVRALTDDQGNRIEKIGPSEMAEITGLGGVPPAGSVLIAVKDDSTAREYAGKRAEHVRQKELSKSTKVSFDELSAMVAEGKLKNLNVIIKSDVQGSLEAIQGSLEKLKNEEVKINVVHAAVGGITESDLTLAGASDNSIILGFNIRPTGIVKEKSKSQGVQIKTYTVIYDLLDDVKALLAGMMSPIIEEETTGQAEVRETFTVSKVGTIAGCLVTDGTIQRGIKVRLIRDGVVIYTTAITSLKRFKDDVKEVKKGYECGIMLEGYNDIQVGDFMETFQEVERQREL